MIYKAVNLQITCRNLRHKLMYVDERQRRVGAVDNSSDTRIFWCVKTQESLGPDGVAVNPARCGSERCCYCGSA